MTSALWVIHHLKALGLKCANFGRLSAATTWWRSRAKWTKTLNSRYDSNMTHNIYNIHIIWLQILFLIQCCKNFWDSPTQNFQMIFSPKCVGGIKFLTSNSNSALNSASDSMWWYGVYIDIIDDSHEDNDCVGVKRYIPWKPIQTVYKSHIITYRPTQNLTLNPNLKSKFLFRLRILEKKSFENFAWANLKKFLHHWIRNKICNHMMCILYMLWVIYES